MVEKKKVTPKKKRKPSKLRADIKITPKEAYEMKKKYPDLSFAKIGKIYDVCPSAVSNASAKYEKEMGLEKTKTKYYTHNKVELLETVSSKILEKANRLLDEDEVKFRELAYAFTQFNQAVRAEKGEVTNDLAGFMNLVDKASRNMDKVVETTVVEAEITEETENES